MSDDGPPRAPLRVLYGGRYRRRAEGAAAPGAGRPRLTTSHSVLRLAPVTGAWHVYVLSRGRVDPYDMADEPACVGPPCVTRHAVAAWGQVEVTITEWHGTEPTPGGAFRLWEPLVANWEPAMYEGGGLRGLDELVLYSEFLELALVGPGDALPAWVGDGPDAADERAYVMACVEADRAKRPASDDD